MHRTSNSDLLPFDLEIEKTLFRRKKVKVDKIEMDDQNTNRYSEGHLDQNEIHERQEPTLGDYCRPSLNEIFLGIRHQPIDTNNFELKPALISMVHQQQFVRSPFEDPNGHLSNFLELLA